MVCVCAVFLQDLEGVGLWSAGVCVVVVYVLLANTDLFLTKPDRTSLDRLASAELRSTAGGQRSHLIHITAGQVCVVFCKKCFLKVKV
uniref:Uncharacterized protein n=1 Tax=Sinocyclocheilus grahami TaxID=75366 RepID=A0A672PLD8_SINGR